MPSMESFCLWYKYICLHFFKEIIHVALEREDALLTELEHSSVAPNIRSCGIMTMLKYFRDELKVHLFERP